MKTAAKLSSVLLYQLVSMMGHCEHISSPRMTTGTALWAHAGYLDLF
jgi:hypothetical protein